MTLNSVVLPPPLGPIRPTIPLSATANVTLRNTDRPPKLWPMPSTSRMSPLLCMSGLLQLRLWPHAQQPIPQHLQPARKASRQEHHDADQRDAKQYLVKVAKTAEIFRQNGDEQRANNRPPGRARTAKHRNQQEAEGFVDVKALH